MKHEDEILKRIEAGLHLTNKDWSDIKVRCYKCKSFNTQVICFDNWDSYIYGNECKECGVNEIFNKNTFDN